MDISNEVLDLLPLACCHIDQAGVLTYANAQALRIFFKSERECLGEKIEDVFPVPLAELGNSLLLHALNEGQVAQNDFLFPLTDRWLRVTATPGSKGVVMSFTDIHDLKIAELADNHFKLLVTASSSMVYKMSADWTKMYHLNGKNKLADTKSVTENWIDKYIPVTEQRLVRKTIAQAIDTKGIFELEHRVIQADGAIGWVYSRAVPVFNEQEEITEWLGAGSDITTRKLAEKALRESEGRFKSSFAKYLSLFNSIDQGFCVIKVFLDNKSKTTDYQFLEMNPAFEAQTGLKNVIGKNMRSLAPKHEELWFDNYGEVALSGKPMRFEAEAAALKRWFDVYAFAIDEPEKHHVALLFNDITARKELEERQIFLLKLSDTLRLLSDPDAILVTAMRLLTEQLGLDRARYYEVEPNGEYLISKGSPAAENGTATERIRMDDFSSYAKEMFRSGKTFIVTDVVNDGRIKTDNALVYDRIDFQSFIGVPVLQDGRFVAGIGLGHAAAHVWSAQEIAIAEMTAERTWTALERAKIEQTLHKAELRLYTVLQQAPIAIAITGARGEVLFRNQIFDELWGAPVYDNAAKRYTNVYRGYHLDGREIILEDWPTSRAVLKGKVIDNEVLEIVNQNGEHIFCSFNAAPIRDQEGTITGGVVLFRDITTERSTAAALRKSEERYRDELEKEVGDRTRQLEENYALIQTIYDTNLIGMSVFAPVLDPNGMVIDFRVIIVNKKMEQAYGGHDMVGKLYSELFNGIMPAGLFELMVKTFSTGEHGKMEYHFAHEETDKWYSASFVKGEDILVSTSLDITERVKAEEDRLRNYLLLQQSEDLALTGSWDFDLLSGTFNWSEGMYKLFDLKKGTEVKPEIYLDFATSDSMLAAHRVVAHLRSADEDFEETMDIKVGENISTLRIKANVVKNKKGNATRILGVDMDITAAREAEHRIRFMETMQQQEIFQVTLNTQEQERRRVSESLHNGLGQLLYGTKLSLNHLSPEIATQNPQKYLQAKRYTDGLLAEAIKETRRISHELMPTVLAEFGLSAAIKEVCEQLQDGVRFSCSVVLGNVKLNNYIELAVFRTVQELMINIVKHAKASRATVNVTALDTEVRILVKDNGQGIKVDEQEKAGIGLSSIRNKVELLKGTISIKSGPGTRIYICFPIFKMAH